ncbi:hypothetical protein, partial [Pseudonocardia abyssalis]
MRSRRFTQAIIAVTASGALAVIGATGAYAATPEQVVPEPPTPVGGLLNGLLVTLQDLLPDVLGGTVPTDTALVPVPGDLAAV